MATQAQPLDPEVIRTFEFLLTRLDVRLITREEWSRFKVVMVIATLEAHDSEAGRAGYLKALAKWERSIHYDGQP